MGPEIKDFCLVIKGKLIPDCLTGLFIPGAYTILFIAG
jgi:hypothetical protein